MIGLIITWAFIGLMIGKAERMFDKAEKKR